MDLPADFLDRFARLGAKPGHEFGDPVAKKLGMLVRPAFIAEPGRTLVWGDWSAIEARVLPWLANSASADKLLDVFRENDADPNKPDIYIITAAMLTGRDPQAVWDAYRNGEPWAAEMRQAQGKVPVLSLGFGGGMGALQAMATNYGVYFDEETGRRTIDAWRETNPWAREFWGSHGRNSSTGLWGAANRAMENPETLMEVGRVGYLYDPRYLGGTLFCILPNGVPLAYPWIKWEWREVEDKKTGEKSDKYQLTFRKGYGRSALWYGKLCLAGDTLVATDRGWVRIDALPGDALVWDGEQFVDHAGVVCNGKRYTIPVNGVRMTPDHEVLCKDGWREAKNVGRFDWVPVRAPDYFGSWTYEKTREAGGVESTLRLWRRENRPIKQLVSKEQTAVPFIMWLRYRAANWYGEYLARHVYAPRLRSLALHAGQVPVALPPVMAKLRRAWDRCLPAMGVVRGVLGGHGAFVRAGAHAGATGQRGGVQPGELPVGHVREAGVEQANKPSDEYARAGQNNRGTAFNAPVSVAPEPVYDIVNAGPGARFVVLGTDGPMIVHNCENITQAAAAHILRRALRRLRAERYRFMPVVAHTHDEIVTSPLETNADIAERELREVMETNGDWDVGLPLKVEVVNNWYYAKSLS